MRCALSLIVKIFGISISLSLAIIQLGANVVQPGGIDAVGLTINGFDQFFRSELFEYVERAVAEQ